MGRFHWNRRTAASIRQAIACFEAAIGVDCDYALAHAGIADERRRQRRQFPSHHGEDPSADDEAQHFADPQQTERPLARAAEQGAGG